MTHESNIDHSAYYYRLGPRDKRPLPDKDTQINVAKGIVRWFEAHEELIPTIQIAWEKGKTDSTSWFYFRDMLWNSMGARAWLGDQCDSPNDALWFLATQRARNKLFDGTFDMTTERQASGQ